MQFTRYSITIQRSGTQNQSRFDAENARNWLNRVDINAITFPDQTDCANYVWDFTTNTATLANFGGNAEQFSRGFAQIGVNESLWYLMRSRIDFSGASFVLRDYVYIWDFFPNSFWTFERCTTRVVTGIVVIDAPELPSVGINRVRYNDPVWPGKPTLPDVPYSEWPACNSAP